eukprot:Gb_05336 [translate_table: standard]
MFWSTGEMNKLAKEVIHQHHKIIARYSSYISNCTPPRYQPKFLLHHRHCSPSFLRLFSTKMSSKSNAHPLIRHSAIIKGFSELKSRLTGQSKSPQKQCLETTEHQNLLAHDVQTIFTIINNHPSSEPSMLPSLKHSGVIFSNELVEKVLERVRFSHANGLKALEFFFLVGHQPHYNHSSDAYNTMLFILARMRKFDRVWELMWEMHRRDVSLITHKTMQIVLARVAKVCSLPETLEAFERFKKYTGTLDTSAFNALLRALCQERNMRDVKYVYHILKNRFSPNTQTFNILLSGWRNTEDARSFYDEMIQLGCTPDTVTYNSLLDALCKGREIREAFKIVEKMRENECPTDVKTYTILIGGLGLIGQPDKACKLLKEMREYGYCPDAAAYNAVIQNFCRARRLSDAYKILDEMVNKGVDPNPNTYNTFVRYYYRTRDWIEAWDLYRRMIGSGCLPNTQTCILLMELFCRHEQLDIAIELWNDMLQKGCGSYSLVLDVLMDVLCDNGKIDEAEKCCLEMIDKGHKPSPISFKRLNVLLELARRHDAIKDLSEKLKSIQCWR